MNKKNLVSIISGKEVNLDDKMKNKNILQSLKTLHPMTQEVITEAFAADDQDIERAFDAAEKAYKIWKKTSLKERSGILLNIAKGLRENAEAFAHDETLDTGKAISETAAVDIATAAECFEFYASLCLTMGGRMVEGPDYYGHIKREPLGVCVGIGAWNYPIQIASWKIAPAIAAGNAMIFRPSELTPRGATNLMKVINNSGIPEGLVNIIYGDRDVSEKLVRHPKTKKISLTGSVATGKKVYALAASEFKNATMELGGKSPLIIFDDADIDEAVKGSMLANFYSSGQICSNGTRVFVHEKVYDSFLNKLKDKTASLVLGDPLDPKTQVGPLISWGQADKVYSYIQSGVKEGAKLLIGGSNHPFKGDGQLEKAPFVSPTVFYDVKDEMKIAQEEIFGPVMSVFKFKTKDEVVERANQTSFGLGAGIFTQNLNLAYEMENRLESGFIWINNYNLTPIEFPFGGVKDSGKGRENGIEAFESYTQSKSIYIQNGPIDFPY